jgi:two-component system CheB/CheR fusion protein
LFDILARQAADVIERKQAEQALRESEQRFRSLTQAITSVVWTTDAEGRFVTPQPSWSQYTGQSWEEARGFGWADAIHADDRQAIRDLWRAACEFKTKYNSACRLWHAASGDYRHVEARGVPIVNADGSVKEWVGKCLDVEDRRRAEEALRDSDRRKDEFLAMLAHELRNPLAPVINSLELMQRAKGDPAIVEQAQATVKAQIEQMVRLIDDLLDVSRISRNKLELRRARVELAPIIRQAVEACRHLAAKADHDVSLTLPPETIHLHADMVRLVQVFGNLLTNACKYTEPGGKIGLTVERQGSDAVVTVKDTGVGIPADMLAKVFDMFTQIDRSLERSQGGLGIGLSLVKRLVEMHEGSVSAHSDGQGRGSEFVVRLPVLLDAPTEESPSEPGVPSESIAAHRILVVDDQRETATLLAKLLEMSGHTTQAAFDGVEAVEAAEKFRPDIILLDIGLPRLNGYDACRKIREQPWGKDMVLIAVTGWGQEGDRQKSKDAGFSGHLVKPVKYEHIVTLLAALETPAV